MLSLCTSKRPPTSAALKKKVIVCCVHHCSEAVRQLAVSSTIPPS